MQEPLERVEREFILFDKLNPPSLNQPFQHPGASQHFVVVYANESVGGALGTNRERGASGPRAKESCRAEMASDSEQLRNVIDTDARSAAEKSELIRCAERQAHKLVNDPRWDEQWYLVRGLKFKCRMKQTVFIDQ